MPISRDIVALAHFYVYTRYYIGGQAYIMISDLDMLKQILVKDFDNFTDHAVSSSCVTCVCVCVSVCARVCVCVCAYFDS